MLAAQQLHYQKSLILIKVVFWVGWQKVPDHLFYQDNTRFGDYIRKQLWLTQARGEQQLWERKNEFVGEHFKDNL